MKSIFFIFFLVLTLQSCKTSSTPPAKQRGSGDPVRGKQIYLANCAACHNVDPTKEGSLGPAIKGSPRELLEARVPRGAYPPGYTPKRKTSIMPTFPDLQPDIPDLEAYLR
jgi:mono/diheme cytochrome c family protein